MDAWGNDPDTPRSTGFETPRDDRFHSPRAYGSSSMSSGEEWQTPRGNAGGVSSDGEYLTPRAYSKQDGYVTSDPQIAYPRSAKLAYQDSSGAKASQFVSSSRQSGSSGAISHNRFLNIIQTTNYSVKK